MTALIFILFLFVLFVGGGWLIGKSIGNAIFPERDYYQPTKHTTVINHFKTENHLHVTEESLKELINDKHSSVSDE